MDRSDADTPPGLLPSLSFEYDTQYTEHGDRFAYKIYPALKYTNPDEESSPEMNSNKETEKIPEETSEEVSEEMSEEVPIDFLDMWSSLYQETPSVNPSSLGFGTPAPIKLNTECQTSPLTLTGMTEPLKEDQSSIVECVQYRDTLQSSWYNSSRENTTRISFGCSPTCAKTFSPHSQRTVEIQTAEKSPKYFILVSRFIQGEWVPLSPVFHPSIQEGPHDIFIPHLTDQQK